ncbi:MAG TPA: aldose epimerase family protein [Streptosporangiaceae bacterium]|nr:aldose epimerase family protein [Streptosporangiaceae bacterium]
MAAIALAGGGAIAATATSAAAAGTKATHASAHHGQLSLTKQFFGNAVEPYTGKSTAVFRYTLTNANGMSVQILTYGGIIQTINVPDKHGKTADVVLGFPTLADYVAKVSPPVIANGGPYFGELIGRYGNRIAKGTFTLNQPGVGPVTYTLPLNNGVNALHGGLVGFGNHIWADQAVKTSTEVGVQLTLVSPNGDESHPAGSPGCPNGCTGYPAQLKTVVTYTLNNNNQIGIHYAATDQSPNLNTVLNLTNHSYFNLAGEGSGSAANQVIRINANRFTPTDSTLIPTGAEPSVVGTPFDFTHPRTIASAIEDCTGGPNSLGCQQLLFAQGLDHNWVLNSTGPKLDGLNLAATARDPRSGRQLTVWTDQPGVQFYTSNFLNGTLVGTSGHIYRQTQAYTFETQHFPDSPNQKNFPSTELDAGKTFTSTTIFAFN